MNHKVSFQELTKIRQEISLKQQPTTLEKARKQVEDLKKLNFQKNNNQQS